MGVRRLKILTQTYKQLDQVILSLFLVVFFSIPVAHAKFQPYSESPNLSQVDFSELFETNEHALLRFELLTDPDDQVPSRIQIKVADANGFAFRNLYLSMGDDFAMTRLKNQLNTWLAGSDLSDGIGRSTVYQNGRKEDKTYLIERDGPLQALAYRLNFLENKPPFVKRENPGSTLSIAVSKFELWKFLTQLNFNKLAEEIGVNFVKAQLKNIDLKFVRITYKDPRQLGMERFFYVPRKHFDEFLKTELGRSLNVLVASLKRGSIDFLGSIAEIHNAILASNRLTISLVELENLLTLHQDQEMAKQRNLEAKRIKRNRKIAFWSTVAVSSILVSIASIPIIDLGMDFTSPNRLAERQGLK